MLGMDREDGMLSRDLMQRLTATDRLHCDLGLELESMGTALGHP